MFSTFNSPVKAPLVRSGLLRCPPPELLSCDVQFKQIEVGSLGEYQKQNLGPGRRTPYLGSTLRALACLHSRNSRHPTIACGGAIFRVFW